MDAVTEPTKLSEAHELVAWLERAIQVTRLTALALERAGETTTREIAGVPVTSLTPRVLLDGTAADAAILWNHRVVNGRCHACAAEVNGQWRRVVAPCWTLRFLATRYRHVIDGWRSEWSG